jgi:hypothetical protein
MNDAQSKALESLVKDLQELQKTEKSTAHSNTALTHLEQATASLKRHAEAVAKKAEPESTE